MKLHKILAGTGGTSFFLGCGGIMGAIQWGTGWITSITLIIIGTVCLYRAVKEGGRSW